MIQKDYILRMIEMLGDLLAVILGLVKKGDFERATESLNQIYYDMLKQDAAFFRTIPESQLTDKLLNEHNYTNGHLEILPNHIPRETLDHYVLSHRHGTEPQASSPRREPR